MRRQVVDPYPGQQKITVVIDYKSEIRNPCVGRPAKERIARLLVPACGTEPDPAKRTMNRRPHPVAKLGTRHARKAFRMMARHHRPPQTTLGVADRLQRNFAELRKPAGERQVREIPLHGNRYRRHRPRRGQRQLQLGRQPRQRLARLRQTRNATPIAPVLPFAKLARKPMARATLFSNRTDQPVDRCGTEMSKPDLHAQNMRQ